MGNGDQSSQHQTGVEHSGRDAAEPQDPLRVAPFCLPVQHVSFPSISAHGSAELLYPTLLKDGPNFSFRINAESSKGVQEPQPS